MAIDRKEYRADKKAYKANKKQGKAGKKDAAKQTKQARKAGENKAYGYAQINLPKPKRSDYKKSKTAVGDGPTPRIPSAKATGSSASTARMKSMYAKVMRPLPTPIIEPLTMKGRLPSQR